MHKRHSSSESYLKPVVQDFQEEQNLVARLVHQLRDPDTDVRYSTLVAARERFAKGGPRRQRHTLAPVAFAALQLVGDIARREGAGESMEVDCNSVGGSSATAGAAAGGERVQRGAAACWGRWRCAEAGRGSHRLQCGTSRGVLHVCVGSGLACRMAAWKVMRTCLCACNVPGWSALLWCSMGAACLGRVP